MLSTPTTGRPDSSRRRAKLKPMKPAAPVTRTGSADMGDLTLDFHRRRRDRVHQAAGFRPDTEVAKGVLRMTQEVKGTPPCARCSRENGFVLSSGCVRFVQLR